MLKLIISRFISLMLTLFGLLLINAPMIDACTSEQNNISNIPNSMMSIVAVIFGAGFAFMGIGLWYKRRYSYFLAIIVLPLIIIFELSMIWRYLFIWKSPLEFDYILIQGLILIFFVIALIFFIKNKSKFE